jgi:hypothetical protein
MGKREEYLQVLHNISQDTNKLKLIIKKKEYYTLLLDNIYQNQLPLAFA